MGLTQTATSAAADFDNLAAVAAHAARIAERLVYRAPALLDGGAYGVVFAGADAAVTGFGGECGVGLGRWCRLLAGAEHEQRQYNP